MATAHYTHSHTFGALKDLQDVKVNLSTFQYLETLDSFLYLAASKVLFKPYITPEQTYTVATESFTTLLWGLVSWGGLNPRRKIAGSNRSDASDFILKVLIHSPIATVEQVKDMRLDRIFVVTAIERVIDAHENDPEWELRIKDARFWLHYYYEWRDMIALKYIRHVLNFAQKDYVSYFHHRVRLDDIINVYIIALHRALDKCSSDLGVLTTYINGYMKTARGVVSRSLDLDRNRVDFAPIDELLIEEHGETDRSAMDTLSLKQDLDAVQKIAAMVDPNLWQSMLDGLRYFSPQTTEKEA